MRIECISPSCCLALSTVLTIPQWASLIESPCGHMREFILQVSLRHCKYFHHPTDLIALLYNRLYISIFYLISFSHLLYLIFCNFGLLFKKPLSTSSSQNYLSIVYFTNVTITPFILKSLVYSNHPPFICY